MINTKMLNERWKDINILIPNEIIENEKLGVHRNYLYAYLYICRGYDGISRFSFKDIFTFAGYKDFKAVGSAKEKIRESLDKFIEHGIFEPITGNVYGNKFISGILKLNYTNAESYVMINLDILNKIMRHRERKVRYTLLNFYFYLLSKMRPLDEKGYNMGFYSYLGMLEQVFHMDFRQVKTYIDKLEYMRLMKTKALPRYRDVLGCWHTNMRLFVRTESSMSDEKVDKLLKLCEKNMIQNRKRHESALFK